MRFLRFNGSSDTSYVNREPGDSSCFGVSWEADDPNCRYECQDYHRCGREYRRLQEAQRKTTSSSPSTSAPVRSNSSSATQIATTNQAVKIGRGEVYRGSDGIIRPVLPAGFPPGTELLPPGKHGPFKRGLTIAAVEGFAAGARHFFNNLGDFFANIPAWHYDAGVRTYGKRYYDQSDSMDEPEKKG